MSQSTFRFSLGLLTEAYDMLCAFLMAQDSGFELCGFKFMPNSRKLGNAQSFWGKDYNRSTVLNMYASGNCFIQAPEGTEFDVNAFVGELNKLAKGIPSDFVALPKEQDF